jgi:hypothetical protein
MFLVLLLPELLGRAVALAAVAGVALLPPVHSPRPLRLPTRLLPGSSSGPDPGWGLAAWRGREGADDGAGLPRSAIDTMGRSRLV